MTVLEVSSLKFGYLGESLFSDASFSLALGDRAAMVAPNGAGKSTLLRLIAGELEPEAGFVVRRKEARLAYYRQSHELSDHGTVLDAFLSGFREIVTLREQLAAAEHNAASGSAEALSELGRLQDAYHVAQGDALERRVAELGSKLGFAQRDLDRQVTTLSGGERGRLLLGVSLASDAEILLLDEPTNHLDLATIRWLEGYLRGLRAAVLLVSHDRAFLDATTNKTLELGVRSLRVYPVKYSDYVVAREVDLERERAVVERQQEAIAKTEDYIRRNIAGQNAKQAQGRRKILERLERAENPEDIWANAERVAFRFAPALRSGDIVLEAKGLSASRGGRSLFQNVNLLVSRGERIAIVGPNGAGKTTLLKLLAGRGAAEDQGSVKRGTNLQEGYFDQHLGELDPSLTPIEEMRRIRGDLNADGARQYLARFRFWGDDPLRRIAGFSGGERSRLALAKLLLEPRNFLFLDEPTNHLDIPAAEILEEALAGFEGTVLFVSHDRRFLENVSTRVLRVEDGTCELFSTNFRDWSEQEQLRLTAQAEAMRARVAASAKEAPVAGRSSFEDNKAARRDQERKKRRVVELEKEIAQSEARVDAMRVKLREHSPDEWEKLAELAQQEQALQRKIDSMLMEWAKVSEEVEA